MSKTFFHPILNFSRPSIQKTTAAESDKNPSMSTHLSISSSFFNRIVPSARDNTTQFFSRLSISGSQIMSQIAQSQQKKVIDSSQKLLFSAQNTTHSNNRRRKHSIDLTQKDMDAAYEVGKKNGATHMLIVCEIYDFMRGVDFIVYCYPKDNIDDLKKLYTVPGDYFIREIIKF